MLVQYFANQWFSDLFFTRSVDWSERQSVCLFLVTQIFTTNITKTYISFTKSTISLTPPTPPFMPVFNLAATLRCVFPCYTSACNWFSPAQHSQSLLHRRQRWLCLSLPSLHNALLLLFISVPFLYHLSHKITLSMVKIIKKTCLLTVVANGNKQRNFCNYPHVMARFMQVFC